MGHSTDGMSVWNDSMARASWPGSLGSYVTDPASGFLLGLWFFSISHFWPGLSKITFFFAHMSGSGLASLGELGPARHHTFHIAVAWAS